VQRWESSRISDSKRLTGVAWLGPIMNEPEKVDADADRMMRVQQGDLQAFEGLVDQYKRPIFNLVYRMLRDRDEAEDITQKVFIQVYRASDRYRPTAKFSTWIFTIARNLTLNEIRRRSRKPWTDSLDETTDGEGPTQRLDPPDHRARPANQELAHQEFLECLEQAIDQLPENQRIAVLLCREGDISYEEMAKVMGCSLSAVKSLIFRGRETIKKRAQNYLLTGDWEDA
jgi:RNA polymerase sigma-70 factor (ECF subfamily)